MSYKYGDGYETSIYLANPYSDLRRAKNKLEKGESAKVRDEYVFVRGQRIGAAAQDKEYKKDM